MDYNALCQGKNPVITQWSTSFEDTLLEGRPAHKCTLYAYSNGQKFEFTATCFRRQSAKNQCFKSAFFALRDRFVAPDKKNSFNSSSLQARMELGQITNTEITYLPISKKFEVGMVIDCVTHKFVSDSVEQSLADALNFARDQCDIKTLRSKAGDSLEVVVG